MYTQSPEHARFLQGVVDSNQMKIGPPYTPLPLEGNALFFPGTLGGGNWGGVSVAGTDGDLARVSANLAHQE
jgi:glucose dehydrogenase